MAFAFLGVCRRKVSVLSREYKAWRFKNLPKPPLTAVSVCPHAFRTFPLDIAGVLPVGIKSLRSAHVQPSPSDTFSPGAARRRNAHAYAVPCSVENTIIIYTQWHHAAAARSEHPARPPGHDKRAGERTSSSPRWLRTTLDIFRERQPGEGEGGSRSGTWPKGGSPSGPGPS